MELSDGLFLKMTDRRFILLFRRENVLFTTQGSLDECTSQDGEEGGGAQGCRV